MKKLVCRPPLLLLVSSISAVAFQQHRPLLYHRKGGAHLLAHSKNCRATDDGERRNGNNSDDQDGSIAGASLLFAGTAVGAGMIALPAETIHAGYVPSIFGLSLCWLFTYVTSISTLEASWLALVMRNDKEGKSGDGVGFLSTSKISLGMPGEVITAVFFWFLLTAIVVAYTAEGGKLIAQIATEATDGVNVSPALGSLLFTSFFASIVIDGTSRVDIINRLFVFGLVSTFIGIVASITPFVQTANLVDQSDWSGLYPSVIAIGVLSFGAQNTVPTILQYLNYDPERAEKAILFGSLIPLLLYTIWETVFLGVINPSTLDSTNMEVVNVLGQIGGTTVTDLVEIFSICAIGSSMAGASVSLVDFFVDAIGLMPNEEPKLISEQTTQGSRVIAAALALGPPLLISYAFPDVFLTALEEAGLLGGVSLYGLLPALCLLSLRSNDGSSQIESMTGRLGGGNITLFAILAISAALILPEIAHLLD